jgi:ferredoxin
VTTAVPVFPVCVPVQLQILVQELNFFNSVLYTISGSEAPNSKLMSRRTFLLAGTIIVPLVIKRSLARDFPIKCLAAVSKKNPANVSGKYYTDDRCIDCDLCRETAPTNFSRYEGCESDPGDAFSDPSKKKVSYSYVSKQPANPEERALCREAMEGCPVEAINDNG